MREKILTVSAVIGQALVAAPALAQTPIEDPPAIPPIGGDNIQDVVTLLATLAGYLMYVAGAIAVVFLIIGGIFYITSTGDEKKTEKAKKILINSLVGIVLIALALLIVKVLASFAGSA